jgi:hypothetical protein
MPKTITITIVTLFIAFSTVAQNRRVQRKGVTPVNTGSQGQAKFTYSYQLEQFKGKWQEIKRTYKNNNPAVINDTIFLYFKEENKVETKDGTKTYIKGEAAIEAPGNVLVAAADLYTIISISNEMMVLDDGDEFIHTFKKVNLFWSETLGKDPVQSETFENPIQPVMLNLMGNWGVYRRQAAPGAIEAKTMLIKNLKITSSASEHEATGEVTFYNKEKSETAPCKIKVIGNTIEISTIANQWNFPVYKAEAKELVFGTKEKLLYFAKPL